MPVEWTGDSFFIINYLDRNCDRGVGFRVPHFTAIPNNVGKSLIWSSTLKCLRNHLKSFKAD